MLKLENIKKVYNAGKANEFTALEGVNLEVEDGEMIALIGKSGAGKSTLLHVMACIDSYEDGRYFIDDTLIKDFSEKKLAEIRNKKIGIVMQDFALIEDFSVIENVLLPLNLSLEKKNNKKELAKEALKKVDMHSMLNKPVKFLSGGQKQRVAIARAIVNDPSVIFADEPTGALDTENSAEIIKLFSMLNELGKTIIIVTHDPEVAKSCKRIVEVSDGKINS